MPKLRVAGIVAAMSLAAATVSRVCALPLPDDVLTAHEWGTFTALQDDDGTALGSINADDEPVPDFVCRIGSFFTLDSRGLVSPGMNRSKGVSPRHPGVNMRLETPVIYFYLSGKRQLEPFNVRVVFHNGWLTEFFPRAFAEAPDLAHTGDRFPAFVPGTSGSLDWRGVELGGAGQPVPTKDPVWTAPREVERAALVKVPQKSFRADDPSNQPEKFLFYRGVGHLNSPLRVVHDKGTDRLNLYADLSAMDTGSGVAADAQQDLRVPAAWLIEIRPEDGFCAFRPVAGPLNLKAATNQPLATCPATFAPGEFGAHRLPELRAAMHEALVTAGLFPDEAAAMLKTWELSYFKSPGRRLFYVAPRDWTERVLPLTIEGASITRAMIGRIELITPAQRKSLARISAGPCPDMAAFGQEYFAATAAAYAEHRRSAGGAAAEANWTEPSPAEMHLRVPAIYQDFLDLGRFRDALVLREQQQRPTTGMESFIAGNALQSR